MPDQLLTFHTIYSQKRYVLQPYACSTVNKSEQFSSSGLPLKRFWEAKTYLFERKHVYSMKTKTRLTIGAAALSGLAAYTFSTKYSQWKQRETVRLATGAEVITTALGPVEYCKAGEGPALLSIHGSPGGYDQSMGMSQVLGAHPFTILAPSRPGYLRTPLSSGASPEAQADLFAALLDELHIEQAIVFATSGGGPSALQFALRYPERCRGLILFCIVAQRYVEKEVYQQLSLGKRLSNQLMNTLILSDPLIYLLQSLASLQKDAGTADLLAALSMASLRKEGYDNDLQQFAKMEPYPLQDINVPTFIAQGTADADVPFAHGQLLADSIPSARFVPVAGAGHLFMMTHQKEFTPALQDFLSTL